MTQTSLWTDMAVSYDRILRHWDPYLHLVDKIVRHLGASRHVLEQGCGTGIVAERLALHNVDVTGIDLNAAMLDIARDCAARLERRPDVGRVHVQAADALHLPFDNAAFDGVVSNNVIYLVSDPRRLLTEARRVLGPGGTLTLSGPLPNPDMGVLVRQSKAEFEAKGLAQALAADFDRFIALQIELARGCVVNTWTLDELVSLLDDVGFSEVLEADDTIYCGLSYFVAVR